ncbi:MAG: type II toxin-antitoxin system HicA family toxin [bacterium]|nr:type II toxin-antitoxin system HicA family toxin [bacterium]
MPKLGTFSGEELQKFFLGQGFIIKSQRSSHVKLRRIVDGRKQTLIIPKHSTVKKGTLREIYTQALAYIPDDILRANFYTRN